MIETVNHFLNCEDRLVRNLCRAVWVLFWVLVFSLDIGIGYLIAKAVGLGAI